MANYFSANVAFKLGRYSTIKLLELLVTKLDAPEVLPNICFTETANNLAELLSKFYLEISFNNNTKNQLNTTSELLRDAFLNLLNENQWMDSDTKSKAIMKLNKMEMNIAYPDWYDNDSILSTFFKQVCPFLIETMPFTILKI